MEAMMTRPIRKRISPCTGSPHLSLGWPPRSASWARRVRSTLAPVGLGSIGVQRDRLAFQNVADNAVRRAAAQGALGLDDQAVGSEQTASRFTSSGIT